MGPLAHGPWGPCAPLPMCSIAHVAHYPCGLYPAHTPCTPYPCIHCGLLPMCSIPPVPHTHCTRILAVPLCPCGSHCPCALYLLYLIALITHVADCPMGDRSDGAHGQWGNSIKGVWGTGGIGHMGNGSTGGMGYGPHGQWVQGVLGTGYGHMGQ